MVDRKPEKGEVSMSYEGQAGQEMKYAQERVAQAQQLCTAKGYIGATNAAAPFDPNRSIRTDISYRLRELELQKHEIETNMEILKSLARAFGV